MNKYEINFNRDANAIVLEKRFSAQQVKRLKSDCTFKIDTNHFGKNSGIYVNILKMRLRQVKLTGVCIDSLTIKYNDDVKKRFCGDLPPGEIKSIEDFKGKVKITLSVDKGVVFNDPDDYIEFQIVATAFKGKLKFSDFIQYYAKLLSFQIVKILTKNSTARRMLDEVASAAVSQTTPSSTASSLIAVMSVSVVSHRPLCQT